MDGIRSSMWGGIAAIALLQPVAAQAQMNRGPAISNPATNVDSMGARPSRDPMSSSIGPESASMRVMRENARKLQHKERLVSSATRLLELTKQFHADVATHAELTADDLKRLDDISKLAHEVKSRMVGD
jgi:hypothetical protein